VDGIEVFFNSLARVGVVYDTVHRKLFYTKEEINQMRNWGSLRDGKTYPIAAMSVDIVGNSQIVREFGTKKAEELSYALLRFLQHKLDDYDGRIWSWAGDGGILAFAFEGAAERAVMCGVDIQRSLPLFCLAPDLPIDRSIALRVGLDAGPVKFSTETGRIVSDVMNYAAHVEKGATEPGCVTISKRVADLCDEKLLRLFSDNGDFEGTPCFTTLPLDSLFREEPEVQESIGTSDQAG
jgi:class 3 adenylate cyclase